MTTPCIITVAITGSLPRKANNPAVPISVSEQIESTHAAFEAGAAIAHIHVRNDDQTPTSSPERFARVQAGLRKHCPGMIIQFSTGGRSGKGSERGGMLHLRPDMASLATGSCNFPAMVYENPPALIRELADEMRRYDVKPEIEVFDLGHIELAKRLIADGHLAEPPLFQICLGISYGAPATPETLIQMRDRLPKNAAWSALRAGIAPYV